MGAEFPVYAPSVDVFSGSHLPKGSGLDLERMFEVNRPRHGGKDVANTREKIGQGGWVGASLRIARRSLILPA